MFSNTAPGFSIPVIFQVASLLAALSHPGHRVIYTLHLSSCCFVGCVHLPQSHSYLCSRGCVLLPPHCNLKSIGYMLPGIRSLAAAMHLEIHRVYIMAYYLMSVICLLLYPETFISLEVKVLASIEGLLNGNQLDSVFIFMILGAAAIF